MTKACSFQGCVAQEPCPVHDAKAKQDGKPCRQCRGTGRAMYKPGGIHIVTDLCSSCGGTGLVDAKRSTRTPKAEIVPVDRRGLIQESEK